MITSDKFRQVMGNFATGITVVTTLDQDGKPYGLTVNSFTSVSLTPLLVLICLDNNLSGFQAFNDSKRFGVSMLSEHQEDLSRMFAKKPAQDLALRSWLSAKAQTWPAQAHLLGSCQLR